MMYATRREYAGSKRRSVAHSRDLLEVSLNQMSEQWYPSGVARYV